VFINGKKLATTVGVKGIKQKTKARTIAREVAVRVIRMTANSL
jgi:hypothetical protein